LQLLAAKRCEQQKGEEMSYLDRAKQRFREKVSGGRAGECWLWEGCRDHRGYGRFYYRGGMIPAHHFTVMLDQGLETIPADLETHHTCQCKDCVNPRHILLLRHQPHQSIHADLGAWDGQANSQCKYSDRDVMDLKLMNRLSLIPASILSKATGIPMRTAYHLVSENGRRSLEPAYEQRAAEILPALELKYNECYLMLLEAVGEQREKTGRFPRRLINLAEKVGRLAGIPSFEIEVLVGLPEYS